MNDAELYHENNKLQKRDAVEFLERFSSKIHWNHQSNEVIDVGCGDGGVTVHVLKRFTTGNIVGCDISEKMIQFANLHHKNESTTFLVIDIEKELPEKMIGRFDHAFSFYVLHWIKKQETAFRNIFDLLTHKGDCLMMFLGHMPMFDVYRQLARNNKWSSLLSDIDKFVSPYHDCIAPEKEITNMMERIGFKNIEVKSEEKCFVYESIDILKKAVEAVTPFVLPKSLKQELIEDYVKVVRDDMKLTDKANNNAEGVQVRMNYTIITVYGTK